MFSMSQKATADFVWDVLEGLNWEHPLLHRQKVWELECTTEDICFYFFLSSQASASFCMLQTVISQKRKNKSQKIGPCKEKRDRERERGGMIASFSGLVDLYLMQWTWRSTCRKYYLLHIFNQIAAFHCPPLTHVSSFCSFLFRLLQTNQGAEHLHVQLPAVSMAERTFIIMGQQPNNYTLIIGQIKLL